LVEALESGKVRSAGLDVYEEEPKIHEGLLNNPNVVLLPHIGTATMETQVYFSLDSAKLRLRSLTVSQRDMELLVLENMKSAVEKGQLVTQVSEQTPRVKL
jgi:glyoxylate reductase